MTYRQLLKYYGTEAAAADKLGWHRQRINRWKRGIPLDAQMDIEIRTRGELKADIPARLIRLRVEAALKSLGEPSPMAT